MEQKPFTVSGAMLIASRVSDLAMKRSTFDSIIKRFNTTPMGKNVTDIVEKSLWEKGIRLCQKSDIIEIRSW